LTPLFVLGLAALLQRLGTTLSRTRRAWTLGVIVTSLFIVWNLGFVFQWGTKMIPNRGPISWRQMIYNQFMVVPGRLGDSLGRYFSARDTLMQDIEREDIRQQHNPG
jgi:hypothetical protein